MVRRARAASGSRASGERVKAGPQPNRNEHVKLSPKRPPGRSTRKARAFEAEIRQLRARGYTFEAIREALAEAGVHVSKSTVQREVAKHWPVEHAAITAVVAVRSRATEPPAPPAPVQAPAAIASTPARTEIRSGKDIAEAFFQGRNTNPLFRNREQR